MKPDEGHELHLLRLGRGQAGQTDGSKRHDDRCDRPPARRRSPHPVRFSHKTPLG